MVEREVFSSSDEFVVSKICTIFKEKGIPYIRKDGGAGNYLSIVYGHNTLSQKKIFVSDENYEEAKELIDFLEVENESESENEVQNALKVIPVEDEFGYKKYSLVKKIFGIFIGIIFLIFFIIFIIQIMMFVL